MLVQPGTRDHENLTGCRIPECQTFGERRLIEPCGEERSVKGIACARIVERMENLRRSELRRPILPSMPLAPFGPFFCTMQGEMPFFRGEKGKDSIDVLVRRLQSRVHGDSALFQRLCQSKGFIIVQEQDAVIILDDIKNFVRVFMDNVRGCPVDSQQDVMLFAQGDDPVCNRRIPENLTVEMHDSGLRNEGWRDLRGDEGSGPLPGRRLSI